MKRSAGFTLIEVLIALTITAIALAAVLQVIAHTTRNTRMARDSLIAHWVARNTLAECQVGLWSLARTPEQQGSTTLLGQSWHWQVRRLDEASVLPATVPVEISVSNHGKVWVKARGRC